MEFEEEYDSNEQELKQELLKFCKQRKWRKVVDICHRYPKLQGAKLTESGETALHIAVSKSTEHIVNSLVESIEQNQERWRILNPAWMPNDQGNTPLHLAALRGNVGMCKCIAGKHVELVGFRNKTGETPLFLTALRGEKDVFLYLHQISDAWRYEYHRRAGDGQTILHVAIIGEYFDLAYQIICKGSQLIYAFNDQGHTPLHLMACKPAVFRSGCRLDGFISRIIYDRTHVQELKEALPDQPIFTDMDEHFSQEPHKDTDKHPKNYQKCIDTFRPLLKMLHNMVERPVSVIFREHLPTSRKHMEANKANIEDPQERRGHAPQNQGSNIEAEETPLPFPPNSRTSIGVLGLIVHEIARFLGVRDEGKKMQTMKEKNIWSVQILDLMLRASSSSNIQSSCSGCDPGLALDMDWYTAILKEKESRSKQPSEGSSEQPTQGREAPILLAAKNGITEMVKRILEVFPTAILDRDSDGKNTVLLAVENRQNKLYEQLLQIIPFNESAFRVVDNKGNNALHLAARIRDYQSVHFAALQMQNEFKWFKHMKHSMPRDLSLSLNKEYMTPEEVFRTSHKDLVKEASNWLIETSNSWSLVATVVTTVAFATVTSPPGGMKEDGSRPNLEHHRGFTVFAISSLIALVCSLASVVSFLSILTPGHRPEDFAEQLPVKFLRALAHLFISLVAMLVCFFSGHFFLMREHNAFLVYGIACLPVARVAMEPFLLYVKLVVYAFSWVPRREPRS